MSYPPCQNPSCKSFGKSHPNCRCYAEGGAVFCSGNRAHKKGCRLFAEGGDTFDPDAYLSSKAPDAAPAPAAAGSFDPDAYLQDKASGDSGGFDPDSYLSDKNQEQYGGTGQQVLTGVEGLAQGVAGPLATAAELGLSKLGVPGVSADDIAGRQAANPWTHGVAETTGLVGSLAIGTGEAALAAKAAEAAAKYAEFGKLGSAAIKGIINNGLIQTGDEASKWMLGQGDPQDPVGAALAHIGAAGLLGAGFSTAGVGAEKGLSKLEEKFGNKAVSFLAGVAHAASGAENDDAAKKIFWDMEGAGNTPAFDEAAFNTGKKLLTKVSNHITGALPGAGIGAYEGYKEDGILGGIKGAAKGAALGKLGEIGTALAGKAGAKIVAPTILKILSSGNLSGLSETFEQAGNVANGNSAIGKFVDGLFHAGGIMGQQAGNAYGKESDRKKLDEYIKNGGVNQNIQAQVYKDNAAPAGMPSFAEGGEVTAEQTPTKGAAPILQDQGGLAAHYPDQNILMNAAKGRVSNYLMSIRPQENAPKLAFDEKPDQREQQRSYDKALDIANKPLGILDEVQNGTLSPEHVQHFNAMYPELNQLMQKKITQRITEAQLKDEKPIYKVRQSLSMLMETALSGEMTPMNIQAAQATFAKAAPQPQQPSGGKGKGSKQTLSKSSQAYLTNDQALQQRQQSKG